MCALRSIFYANPWIEQHAFKGVVEIRQNWLVVESRFSLLVRGTDVEWAVRCAACSDITSGREDPRGLHRSVNCT